MIQLATDTWLEGLLPYHHPSKSHLCSAYFVSVMQQPREEQMNAAKHVLHYLKDTVGCGLLLSSKNDLQLYGYCDSD